MADRKVKLEEMKQKDIDKILKTVCDELHENQTSIANINRSIKVNDSVDRKKRGGYLWSYDLDADAPTNSTGYVVEFSFMQARIGKSFDVTIGLPDFANSDSLHSFEITYERYENDILISLEELTTAYKNNTVIM